MDDVYDGSRLLVTPMQAVAPGRAPRLALAYLCARLGERLALGQLPSLERYHPADDDAVDMHHLRTWLAHPVLARLDEALHAPELLRTLAQMRSPAAAD